MEGVGAESLSGADRRKRIIAAAENVFWQKGFSGASMSEIAAHVGGSKATLYAYFNSKEELFSAIVTFHCETLGAEMSALLRGDGEFMETLRLFGRKYIDLILSDSALRKMRAVIGEVERTPSLGRSFYEAGPATGLANLSRFLAQRGAEAPFRVVDPAEAAQIFLSTCNAGLLKALFCNPPCPPSAEEKEKVVTRAITILRKFYE